MTPLILAQSNGSTATPANKKGANAEETTPVDGIPKQTLSVEIRDGMLTVDGLVVKAGVNYDVESVPFLYFFLPGIGTAVVAREHIPNSTPQKNAFHGSTLTIHAFGHEVELSNANPLLSGKNKSDDTAWVSLDNDYTRVARTPMMGYGLAPRAPYQWPGAKILAAAPDHSHSNAPPLPASAKPTMESNYSVTVPGTTADNPSRPPSKQK
ncbi:hypothetical protein FTO74_02085 [Granulicella sp. WH15]|uniref:hypothetical protein n=1 Tax=Granulicella sp. WH15 TaxID=2602070 RepID=UPI001366D8B8|nr:hypothetical protein [Granulicella sp. WH15]QHN02295.1 hypothetical protein FTO74_02085 [Granulicella sp. WH15]